VRHKYIDLKLETLKTIPGLERCTDRDLQLLARYCDELSLTAGTTLVTEGRPGRQAYIVVEGRAEVRRGNDVLWEVGPGSLVGDLGVLGPMPAAATIIATTPVRLLALDPRATDVVLGRVELARWAYGQVELRLRRATSAPAGYTRRARVPARAASAAPVRDLVLV
jgi:CRP/FNR family transcriptional regulator, cyclic AMP receptor protein